MTLQEASFPTSYLIGILPCSLLCKQAQELCTTNNPYFRSPEHRIFMFEMTRAIFIPDHFIHTVSWFNDMVDLAITYKQQGHKIFLLSNLNDEHFALLKKTYPHHIDFFDGSIISGLVHLAKPNPAIYHKLLSTYNLNPTETIFIDDQAINCSGAESCGITSIVCPQKRSWTNLWFFATRCTGSATPYQPCTLSLNSTTF
jgi:FMN phosphatase YigB (HAD superfamily)